MGNIAKSMKGYAQESFGHSNPANGSQNREHRLRKADLQIERKTFIFVLADNDRGRILKITEMLSGGGRNCIIIPASGLENFKRLLEEMARESASAPEISNHK